jgi:hypothetical protein
MKLANLTAIAALGLGLLAGACSDGSSGPGEITSGAYSLQAAAGNTTQAAGVGTAVSVDPAVIVKDASGNVLAGQTVVFAVTAGNGTVTNPVATTNAQGVASAGKWTLGAIAGINTVEARVGALAPVRFNATATLGGTTSPPTSTSPYAITVRYLVTPSVRQQQAVVNAIARWETVITQDLIGIPMNAPADACWDGQPAINERVDDILIFVEFVEIDGAGKVLGEAGPCYVRSDNGLPVVGHLKLDAADLRQMESYGTIDDVVLHEIGHVLGIGTLWPDKGLLSGQGTTDPSFLGAGAISAYRTMGGTQAFVPVENTGGTGTRDGHWRESVFANELMTGWVNSSSNPLSALTIESLKDLGYGANPGAASNFTLSASSGSSVSRKLGTEIMKRPKFKVDRQGRRANVDEGP